MVLKSSATVSDVGSAAKITIVVTQSVTLGRSLPLLRSTRQRQNDMNRRNGSRDVYEIRPRKDRRGFDLISDALPFGQLCYGGPNAASNAVSYAMHYSRSHDALIRVYDEAGNLIETHERKGDFKEW